MKTLWEISLYSRYGKTKILGFICTENNNIPFNCIKKNLILPLIEKQPCTLSFNIIKEK